jgi:hypothetical protein
MYWEILAKRRKIMSGKLYEYLRECQRGQCLSYIGESCNCGRQEALKEYAELKEESEISELLLGKAWDIIDHFGFLIFLRKRDVVYSFDKVYEDAVKWLREYEESV